MNVPHRNRICNLRSPMPSIHLVCGKGGLLESTARKDYDGDRIHHRHNVYIPAADVMHEPRPFAHHTSLVNYPIVPRPVSFEFPVAHRCYPSAQQWCYPDMDDSERECAPREQREVLAEIVEDVSPARGLDCGAGVEQLCADLRAFDTGEDDGGQFQAMKGGAAGREEAEEVAAGAD